MPTPTVSGMLEWAVYVEDVAAAEAFYRRVFGFTRMARDERLCALGVAERQVLLLFRRGASVEGVTTQGGRIPGHDGAGRVHFAFAIAAEELGTWREHLGREGIEIESEVQWPRGGRSLYFRDPEGSLIELATPGVWAVY